MACTEEIETSTMTIASKDLPHDPVIDIDLPPDLVIEILSRLPVKTLVRFQRVCKSWNATITHPTFITTHLHRASRYTNDYVLRDKRLNSEEERKLYLLSDQIHDKDLELKIPFQGRYIPFKLVGTINGVICLVNNYSSDGLFLWNPSIRKFKTLPSSSITDDIKRVAIVSGFGFHRQTNDYKVVKIVYFRKCSSTYIIGQLLPSPQVEVYTLSTDSWRKIEAVIQCFPYDTNRNADVFTNGSIHWVASSSLRYGRGDTIMSFDTNDEVIRKMMMPDYDTNEAGPRAVLKLGALKESLSLCVCFCDDTLHYSKYCHIWVMREYGVVESWTKQFTIEVPEGRVKNSLGFTKNNEVVLELTSSKLVSYDTDTLQLKYFECFQNITCMIPFVETLVLLGGENAPSEQENLFTKGIRLAAAFFFLILFLYCEILLWDIKFSLYDFIFWKNV